MFYLLEYKIIQGGSYARHYPSLDYINDFIVRKRDYFDHYRVYMIHGNTKVLLASWTYIKPKEFQGDIEFTVEV